MLPFAVSSANDWTFDPVDWQERECACELSENALGNNAAKDGSQKIRSRCSVYGAVASTFSPGQ